MKKVHLTREQRYTIFAMNKQGCRQKQIAQAIGKDKSVVSRELKRNANPKGRYSFEYAQYMASMHKERMKKPRKLHHWLKKEITGMIEQDWSPQQIEGKLKMENKPFVVMKLSIKSSARTRQMAEHFISIPDTGLSTVKDL